MQGFRRFVFAASVLMCTSCTDRQDTVLDYGASGGVVGAASGAGIGAAVGAIISNGDIGASALLGGGIGLAAGIAVGVIAHQYAMSNNVEDYANQIRANQAEIAAKQRQIDSYRGRVLEDSRIDIDTTRSQYIYSGQKLGNAYR